MRVSQRGGGGGNDDDGHGVDGVNNDDRVEEGLFTQI